MKTISLKETKKALIKLLEIPGNEFAIAETANEDNGIRVDFKFNMRRTISNSTFFKNAAVAMERYDASLTLEPKPSGSDGPWIELSISMKVSEIKP